MRKALFKERKNYISVILVPHSHGKVKVFKFSSLYAKLGSILMLFTVILGCTAVIVASLLHSNSVLRQNIAALGSVNAEQRALLADKVNEIESLKIKGGNVDKTINEFMNKYREITDTYINTRAGNVLASRSGDRNEKTFVSDINELRQLLQSIDDISSAGSGKLTDLSSTEDKLKKYLDSLPTLWPSNASISDKFGYRRDPFTRIRTFHEGLDLSADYGSDVRASGSGKVIFAGKKSGYGNAVMIDHGRGLTTLYGHMSKILVKEGQTVSKGDAVGRVGNSGRSTGPHLHFEVRFNDEPVDPIQYLDGK